MARYYVTDPAAADMAQLWDGFIERGGSPANADRLTDGLLSSFQALADFPDIGTSRPYLAAGILAFPHEGYMIFYRKRPDGVDIAHVLYGGMDLESFFPSRNTKPLGRMSFEPNPVRFVQERFL